MPTMIEEYAVLERDGREHIREMYKNNPLSQKSEDLFVKILKECFEWSKVKTLQEDFQILNKTVEALVLRIAALERGRG